MRRQEFTLCKTKNGETRVIPMTPDVFDTFAKLHTERRLDTPRVFLYNGKTWKNHRTAFAAAFRRAGVTGLRLHDLPALCGHQLEAGKGGHDHGDEDHRTNSEQDASAVSGQDVRGWSSNVGA
jgi:integrase